MPSTMKFKNAFRFTEHSDSMMAFWDKDLVCRFANSAYLIWFGYSPEELIDQVTLPQLLGPIYKDNLPYIANALKGKVQVFERELTQTDGTIRNTLATYTPEIIEGKVTGFFVHVVDITFVSPPRSGVQSKNAMFKKQSEIDDRLKAVEQLLRESLFLEFPGIDKLAKECFISPTKLKRDFKAMFNFTPFSYYRNLQMQIADKYLKENLHSKKQISDIFGFANQSNFMACYKKHIKNSFADK
jgi:PAS domain S-box-containing protein